MDRRRSNNPPEEEGSPAWMNTYGDMITLVLTFFVLLFSFSTIDAQKWQKLVSAMNGTPYIKMSEVEEGFNDDAAMEESMLAEPTATPEPTLSATQIANMEKAEQFDELYEELTNYLTENGLETILNVEKDNSRIILRMSHSAFFDSGTTELDAETKEILAEVCVIIEEYRDVIANVYIEGHTDNVPIRSYKFNDNWDLSVLRATSVLRYIATLMDFNGIEFVAAGYGELYPIASNETEEGREQNRRVDFVISSNIEE